MEKKIAKTDITYCVNDSCSQKENCFRYIDKYNFDKNKDYSFGIFWEDYCNKGVNK